MKTIISLVLLATITTSGIALADNACNTPKLRAYMVEAWNEITDEVEAIDAYNFETKAYNPRNATITCEGTIEDGYGDKYKVRFKQYKNSFGELIVGFEMID